MQGGLKEAPQSWDKSRVLVQVSQEHREKPREDLEHQPPLVNIILARESRGCHRGIRAAPLVHHKPGVEEKAQLN